MERRVNFLFIGIIFFAIFAALVVFIIIMGRFNFDDKHYKHYVVYTTHDISGLGINTPVRYKGIGIGGVTNISFDTKQLGVVRIDVRIKDVIPVREGSSLVVDSQGLAGMSFLSLRQNEGAPFIKDEDKAVLKFEPSLFGRLGNKADQASAEILELLKSMKVLLNENNLNSTGKIIGTIDRLSLDLDELIKNLNTQVSNGDYNIREVLNPLMLRLNTSLNYMDQFFKRGSNVLEKFEKDPYNTLFGEQKK